MFGGRTALSVLVVLVGCQVPAFGSGKNHDSRALSRKLAFNAVTGEYAIQFSASKGTVTVTPKGKKAHLAIRELGVGKQSNLFYSVKSVRHSGTNYTLAGRSAWTSFTFKLGLDAGVPGLIRIQLSMTPHRDAPTPGRVHPDVQLVGASASSIKQYDPAPPIAGTSVFLSNGPMSSSILYLANLTSLGTFFDRTQSGASQPNFTYPRAGGKGSLVGLDGAYFGYPAPFGGLNSLPRKRSTIVIDSYLYMIPGQPKNESEMAAAYLKLLGGVYGAMPKPAVPTADWHALAAKAGNDLASPSNLVTVDGKRFLVSYVSDTRTSPELLTQASVLAGLKAYEARYHEAVPLSSLLEQNLPAYYDSTFHTVKNGLGHDANATEESWYYVTNLISLLQLTQGGSTTARRLLLDSIDGAINLAHTNNYEFPQTFHFSDWNGKDTGLQSDVAGGYAWLMLGLFDLTKETRFLDEAKASIVHVGGKGFGLAYETHMLGYAAAAAERLYVLTKDPQYHAYADLALANLFHVTRLWDCTYGHCRKGSGYHTYFGINPLPWSDYIAPLEQYEAWLGLRDYMTFAQSEPGYVKNLVDGFLTNTPSMMQYALPARLPEGVVTASPGEYPFVSHNNLTWNIPLEDLRTGDQVSGIIGQEIYGAGAPFVFAAFGP